MTDFQFLKSRLDSYSPISDATWQALQAIARPRVLSKKEVFCQVGDQPSTFGFIASGLMRVFIADEKGAEYNKNFFIEGEFPGSMVALLQQQPSAFSIEALEETRLIEIDFAGYRKLLATQADLKDFQIAYLETNWLIGKESREVGLVQETATERYQQLMQQRPELLNRIPQYHLASHLGVTPIQLSRIRKELGLT